MNNTPLLSINDLSVVYQTEALDLPVLRNIDLSIQPGQIYGIVGESGSGKSTLGLTIMRYLAENGKVTKGKINFDSQNLLDLDKNDLRDIWGKEISFVPQDPFSSLNPSIKIGNQIEEIFIQNPNITSSQAKDKTIEWLNRVRLPDAEELAKKYPHELSGGQKQRILVAMALCNNPKLLILDEPTTSLDVTTEVVILELIKELIRKEGTSTIFITHNLNIVANFTDRVAVLYAGEIVEDAPTQQLFSKPVHPYTFGLLNSIPKIGRNKSDSTLASLPGQIPPLNAIPKGCIFANRCPLVKEICRTTKPTIQAINNDQNISCHRWQEIISENLNNSQIHSQQNQSESSNKTKNILELTDVEVTYNTTQSGIKSLLGLKQNFNAVNKVSFKLPKGQTIGIVGESGSGKSSLALAIMGLINDTSGDIKYKNINLPGHINKRKKSNIRDIQMVFQSHDEAFSPHVTVHEILSRPLKNLLNNSKDEMDEKIFDLLDMVRLPRAYANRYPTQLSGGEKQRVAIARAFAATPDLFIADEPVSALDVSVQANILNLLRDLQEQHQISSIFISHDIAVITYMSDLIAVMYLGQIMQFTPSEQLLSPPFHPYTEALLSAIPTTDQTKQNSSIRLEGDIPSPLDIPKGCPFQSRCPRAIEGLCEIKTPPMQITPQNKQIYCHIPWQELEKQQTPIWQSNNAGAQS